MAHETFYNSLLVAMGNVVSALLMYALQAAWLCQRLIDQDYRQNHGSRLKAIVDLKEKTTSEPIEILTGLTEAHKQPSRRPRRHGENKRRRHRRTRTGTATPERGFNFSHPCLEGPDAFTSTSEYVSRLGSNIALRRAFSDINLSSGCSEFGAFDTNQNRVSDGRSGSVTDQDLVRLIFNKGYVT